MPYGKTALVTGATSGIGAAFAWRLASEGYDLIITGRRRREIQAVAEDIKKSSNVKVDIIIAELSDTADLGKLIRKIGKTAELRFLVNNAGFGIEGPFNETDISKNEEMILVHNLAAVKLTHAAIPVMLKNGGGVIINVSSLSGRIFIPGLAIYNSTKAFLIAFSETLSMELHDKNIKVQALCPGFTRTYFHDRMGYSKSDLTENFFVRWMSPADVVDYSMKSIDRGVVVAVPGILNRIVFNIPRILPSALHYSLLIRADKRRMDRVNKRKLRRGQ